VKKLTLVAVLTTLLIGSLLMSMLASVSGIQLEGTEHQKWIVDSEGTTGFSTIQEAINAAHKGDTVLVQNGTYHENVVINKSISLIGESPTNTTVDGGSAGPTLLITAGNTFVSGFTILNGVQTVYVDACSSNTIEKNVFQGGFDGIFLFDSENNTVDENVFSNIFDYGVLLAGYCSNSIVRDNIVEHTWYGIGLWDSSNNTVYNNTVEHTGSTNGTGIDRYTVPTFEPAGVLVYDHSKYNKIIGNKLCNTGWNGIAIVLNSTDNLITENVVSSNYYYGVWVENSSGNFFNHNLFNNQNQVYIHNASNTWDNGYPSGGNYWSDYTGVDVKKGPNQNEAGSDGIGDTPYVIDANNVDRYPLENPYGSPAQPMYALTIGTATNGTTDPTPGTYTYSQGQNVTVQDIPNVGHTLDHWELDGTNVGSANPYSVLMDNNHTLQAAFVPGYTLTITATTGGTTNPLLGSHIYDVNTSVLIAAIPSIYRAFDHWELDGVNVGSANPYSVLMDNDHILKAVFQYHDVAITNMTPFKTVVGQGYSTFINVTVANQGDYSETFNLTAYANTTIIQTKQVALTGGSFVAITFTWNTAGFAKGNYTISAYSWPVQGQTNTSNNTFMAPEVIHVVMPGDAKVDRVISILDVVMVTSRYGAKRGDKNYDPNVDWNNDGKIDILDVVIVTSHYGQKDP
jgi:parallel beta-helix repeat protein